MEVLSIVEHVTAAAKAKANDAKVVYPDFAVGDLHWQGDVGVLCICQLPGKLVDDWPHGRQVAPGNTQGSRHVAEGDVKLLTWAEGGPLVGPVIRAKDRWTLAHPEHGHVEFPGQRDYVILYQRAYADELRRKMD